MVRQLSALAAARAGLVLALLATLKPEPDALVGVRSSVPESGDTGAQVFPIERLAGTPTLLSFIELPGNGRIAERDPNRSQIVFLRSMAQQYGHLSLRIAIAVSVDGDERHRTFPGRVANFRHDSGLEGFPVFEDEGGRLGAAFRVRVFPTTLLLDGTLRVERRWSGVVLPNQLSTAIESSAVLRSE